MDFGINCAVVVVVVYFRRSVQDYTSIGYGKWL